MNRQKNMDTLRESYYSIKIGGEAAEQGEPVWVKKLRNILDTDIHQKTLGCRISDTHIKIGTGAIHMSSFFEAQLLFSHAKWINRFSMWLEEQLESTQKPCLIVGYETYIEPLLANLKSRCSVNNDICYCIYEEPKYTQRDSITTERLRYIDEAMREKKIKSVVFLCGISSTLSTHEKMQQAFLSYIANSNHAEHVSEQARRRESFIGYSIVQILAERRNNFQLNDEVKLEWNRGAKTISYKKLKYTGEGFIVHYLVDVDAEWNLANNCAWCFPENNLEERPLITTGPTSVIPVQRIGVASKDTVQTDQFSMASSLLFKRHNGSFLCRKYLYYNHLERGDHHYRYYLRTGSLFDYVKSQGAFTKYCNSIRKSLKGDLHNDMHIIIAPLHFSNDRFPQEINRRVFDNLAHVISFDPKSEFRSNFETKYSNYAYVLEQINQINEETVEQITGHKQIYFYFVDDEIITGATYYRAKSFVTSLMQKYSQKPIAPQSAGISYQVFAAVITLVDRTSDSTKLNYVNERKDFHHFIHFSIPSLRNYGDACPICKQIEDARNVADNCCLTCTAQYWKEKQSHLRVMTLQEAWEYAKEEPDEMKQRHFTRMYCENLLWEKTKSLWGEKEIGSIYLKEIYTAIRDMDIDTQYEYLISFLKAISRPFLFYKENGKKATLKILLALLTGILNTKNEQHQMLPSNMIIQCALTCGWPIPTRCQKQHHHEDEANSENYIFEHYCLLCVLISCLSEVGSNYLLKAEHIENLCDYVDKLAPSYSRFNHQSFKHEIVPGFYTILVNHFKSLVCGVSGNEKSNWADAGLWKHMCEAKEHKRKELYCVLYLENIQKTEENNKLTELIQGEATKDNQNTITKYQALSKILSGELHKPADCTFFASYGGNLVELTNRVQMNVPEQRLVYSAEETLTQLGYFQKGTSFWVMYQPENSRPASDSNDITRVYLRLRFQNEDIENLKDVRRLLIQREVIMRMIQADIETGALKTAIQAQSAELILLTDKTQSHGQSDDINRLFRLVSERFMKIDEPDPKALCDALGYINLFMNRCIAFGGTKTATRRYLTPGTSSLGTLQPFFAGMQFLDCDTAEKAREDLKNYLKLICERSSTYIESIKNDLTKKHGRFEDATSVNIVVTPNDFSNISYMPFITNNYEARMGAVVLIGIIDIFVRNAIEHGGKDCNIYISCEMGEKIVPVEEKDYRNSYESSYLITVKNDINPSKGSYKSDSIGFTKLFLTEYLKQFTDKYRYFSVTMEKIEETKYCSQLLCLISEVGGNI